MIPLPYGFAQKLAAIVAYLHDLTAITAPASGDEMMIGDASDSYTTRKITLANLQKILGEIFAGDNTTSGLSEVDGVGRVDIGNTTASTAPTTASKILVEIGGVNKSVTLASAAKAIGETMAGSVETSGVSEVDGVLTAAIKLLHLVADEKSALFVETGEFDFSGSAGAVDTKKIDSMAAKGQLLFALISVSQVADGTTSAVLSISKAAAAATKMATDLTITLADTVYQNKVGNCMIMWPVAGADSIVASEGDVYLYAAASGGRTAGKVKYALFFIKTA
jgi:hypothetical protein